MQSTHLEFRFYFLHALILSVHMHFSMCGFLWPPSQSRHRTVSSKGSFMFPFYGHHLSPASSLATIYLSFSSKILLFYKCYTCRIMHYLAVWNWVLSFLVIPLKSILSCCVHQKLVPCESTPCIAILISTSKNPCSFLLLLIHSPQQN
jgi:hypothetical protein